MFTVVNYYIGPKEQVPDMSTLLISKTHSTTLNDTDRKFLKLLKKSLNLENNTLTNPEEIVQSIELLNGQHEVLNVDRFGPLESSNVEAVLLVQVTFFTTFLF